MPNLLPSTSLHYTPTSAVATPNRLLKKKSSTSKANLSICKVLNKSWADSLVKSLNPHWVSLLLIPRSKVIIILKTKEMNWRYHFLSTFPYSYNLLDPTTITSLFYLYFSIYFSLPQTLLSSENVVAPSASTINAYLPRTKHIPALTAPPFPLFLGY